MITAVTLGGTASADIVTGTGIEVQADVDSRFSVSNESADKGTASLSGNSVTWNIDALGDESATLTYDVSVDCAQGGGPLPVHDSISYTDNEGNVVDLSTLGLTVNLRGCAADVALAPETDTNPVGDDHTVTATVTDDFGDPVEGVDVTFDVVSGPNAGTAGSDTTDASGEAAITYTGANGLGTDSITASFEAADGSIVISNTAEKEWVDITAPVLDMPDDIEVEADSPSGASNVDLPEPTATDDVDPSPVVTCDASSGAFPLGVTTVTCTATDASGNSSSDTFTVTVTDTTPPEISCAEGVNPSGKNVPKAGKKSPGQNEDGFYELSATDNLDGDVEIWVSGFGPFQSGDVVKITEAPGATPKLKSMGGAVTAHLILDSDAVITATDSSGNSSSISCLVPPDPK